MIVERDKLAAEARERLFRNDLRPMAKWLRRQNNLNAVLLADLIEEGKIFSRLRRSDMANVRHIVVGEFIGSKKLLGWTATAAIEEAMTSFAISKRDAERATEVWEKTGGANIRAALAFLKSPPKQAKTGGDDETLGD